jgi:hypothetical protein
VLGAILQKNPFLLHFAMPHAPSDPDLTIIWGPGNRFYGRPVSAVGRPDSAVGRPVSAVQCSAVQCSGRPDSAVGSPGFSGRVARIQRSGRPVSAVAWILLCSEMTPLADRRTRATDRRIRASNRRNRATIKPVPRPPNYCLIWILRCMWPENMWEIFFFFYSSPALHNYP